MVKGKSPVALFVSLSIAAVGGQSALAQSGGASNQAGPALEEIVVTARKREESLQDVPLAVTAITAQDIVNRQVNTIDDIAKFAPGLVFSKTFGRATERPVVRGLASILAGTNASVETGVSYFVDGVYYQGDIGSLDMNDVERVEVIRGPQSALYGRNTYSGAINFVTRRPGDVVSGGVNGSFDPDERNASFRIAGPLTDTLSGSLNGRFYDFDGQWKNELTGKTIGSESTTSFGASLLFTPSEGFELRVRAGHNRDDDNTRPLNFQSAELNNCAPGTRSLGSYSITGSTNNNQYYCGEIKAGPIYLNDAPVTQPVTPLAGIPASIRLTPFITPTGGVYDTRQALPFSGVKRDLDWQLARLRWDIAGSGYNLIVSGGRRNEDRYTGADSDHSQVNIITANVNGVQDVAVGSSSDRDKFEDWSGEVKLESPQDGRFRWLVGAYRYNWERRGFRLDFVSPTGQDNPYSIFKIDNKAVFGSAEFDLTDALTATVEVRRAREKKGQKDWVQVKNLQAGPSVVSYDSALRGNDVWTSTTPRVTLNYKASDDITLFANYAKGYKPGGFNGATAFTANLPSAEAFKQEESVNYELGMKSTWMDRRLLLNVSVFKMKISDIQLTTPVNNPTTGAITSLATNQGDGEIKGLEIESRFAATDELTLGFNYALADTQFTKGCDDFQFVLTSGGGILNPSNPADPTRNLNGKGDCSIVGKEFPLAAKHSAALTADYLRPVFGGDYRLYVNSDLSYTSKKWVQVHNLAYTGSAVLLGLRLGIETDSWKAGFYGRNLLNEDSLVGATRWLHSYLIGSQAPGIGNIKPGLPSSAVASYSLPRGFFGTARRERQIGIEASYKF